MNTIARGTVAELCVATELSKKEITICMPLNHSSEYDLIADTSKGLERIQVKRAYINNNHGYKQLCVETRRIMVKHSGKKGSVAKSYSQNGFDYLIACDVDNNNFWIIPIKKVLEYKAQIYLGSKMEQYKNQWSLVGVDVSS